MCLGVGDGWVSVFLTSGSVYMQVLTISMSIVRFYSAKI